MQTSEYKINEVIEAFLTAPTWQDGKKLVEANREILLDVRVDNILLNRIWEAVPLEDQWAVANLQISRRILDDCRARGINEGFATWLKPQPAEYATSLYENFIMMGSEQEKMNLRIMFPEIEFHFFHVRSAAIGLNANLFGNFATQLENIRIELSQIHPLFDPFKWAFLQNYMGKVMALNDQPGRVERLQKAVEIWKFLLEILQVNLIGEGMLWAEVQVNLAMAYTDGRYPGNRFKNFDAALLCFEDALKVYSRKFAPLEWATTGAKMAHILMEHPNQDFAGAVEHMMPAIHILSQYSEDPILIAKNEADLGTFYLMSNSGNLSENIENAISYYKNALQVFVKFGSLDDQKKIYKDLGDAFSKRQKGDPSENQRLATRYIQMAMEDE